MTESNPALLNEVTEYKQTSIEVAIINNQSEVMEYLLTKVNPNMKVSSGVSLLCFAAMKSSAGRFIKKLIEAKASVNDYDPLGWGPLQHAVRHANPDVVEILLEAGACPDFQLTRKGMDALLKIAEIEFFKDKLEYYLKKKNGGHIPDKMLNFSAFELALWLGRADLIQVLHKFIHMNPEDINDIVKTREHRMLTLAFSKEEKIQPLMQKSELPIIKPSLLNEFLLSLRFKDTTYLFNMPEQDLTSENQNFLKLAKAMLLGYGFTNTNHGTGLFRDPYFREARPTQQFSLKDETLFHIMLSTFDHRSAIEKFFGFSPSSNGYPVISHNEYIAKMILPYCTLKTVSYAGKMYYELRGMTYPRFGKLGLIPNKDSQLWIIASLTANFPQLFNKLLIELKPTSYSINQFPIFQRPLSSPLNAKNRILKDLKNQQIDSFKDNQFFYITLMENLIGKLPLSDFQNSYKNYQLILALSRLEIILKSALTVSKSDYSAFLNFLEFALDEISFIITMENPYTKSDLKQILTQFIDSHYQFDSNRELKNTNEIDTHVMLGSSGMHVLTTQLAILFDEIKNQSNYQGMRIYLKESVYFEISELFKMREIGLHITHKTHEISIPIDCKDTNDNINNQIFDIMITGFQENITEGAKAEFRSNDILKLIDHQFFLRSQNKISKKLIIIIDTTLTTFDDSYVKSLLMNYRDDILAGNLTILIFHSLNKYFHMGLDKTSAGIGIGFFNSHHHPKLAHFFKNEWMNGFEENDPTCQTVSHLIKNASSHILDYNHIIKANTRYIHEIILPQQLLRSKPVFVHSPYTSNLHRDIWGFILVEIPIAKWAVQSNLIQYLKTKNITERDGYGFSSSTYTCWLIKYHSSYLLRISIGTESKEKLHDIFEPFFNIIMEGNKDTPKSDQIATLQNHKNEMFRLAQLDEKENGLTTKSLNLYLQASDLSHGPSLYQLGLHYERGCSLFEKDQEEAVNYFRKAAEENYPPAQFKMGLCSQHGNGIHKSIFKARRWYQEASDNGYSKANNAMQKLEELSCLMGRKLRI